MATWHYEAGVARGRNCEWHDFLHALQAVHYKLCTTSHALQGAQQQSWVFFPWVSFGSVVRRTRMIRSQTIAEVISGQPGTFVYFEPHWFLDISPDNGNGSPGNDNGDIAGNEADPRYDTNVVQLPSDALHDWSG
jgi:hypothetical protein